MRGREKEEGEKKDGTSREKGDRKGKRRGIN